MPYKATIESNKDEISKTFDDIKEAAVWASSNRESESDTLTIKRFEVSERS